MSILNRNISSFFFFTVLILLISISIISYQTITSLVKSYELVNHTHLVKSKITETESYIKDAESALFIYAATTDTTYLQPIDLAYKRTILSLNELDSLISDNATQQKNINRYRELSKQRFYNVYGLVHISQTRKVEEASRKHLLDEGKLLMDSINTLKSGMIDIENNLLKQREKSKDRSAFVTPKLALFFIMVSLGFVAMSFFKIRHELANQQQVRHELRQKNEELNELYTELLSSHKLNENAEFTANLGNFVWNLTTSEILPTKNFFRLINFNPNEFQPSFENITDLVLEEDRKKFLEEVQEIEKSGEPMSMIFRIRSGSGEIKHIKSTGIKLYNSSNEEIIAGSWQDISELISLNDETKKLNRQLLLQNETFRHAEEASMQGSYRWNIRKNIIYYSDNLFRLFDCEPGEFEPSTENFFKFIYPEDLEMVQSLTVQARANGIITPIQYRLITKKGKLKYVKTSGRKIYSEGEMILIGTLQDITSDVIMAENLRSREMQLSEALSVGRLGSWEANFEKKKLNWSNEMYRLFGYEPGEIEPDLESFGGVMEEDRESVKNAIKESSKTGNPLGLEYRRLNKDGEIRYVFSKGVVKRDRNGRIVGMVGINMDITGLRKSEQMLQQKNRELENRNHELASFNYIASHDLQEPLRKIITFSKIIQDREKLPESASDYFTRIVSAAGRMQNLINSLLNLSLINKAETTLEPTDLNIILTEVLTNNQDRLDELNAKVTYGPLPKLEVNGIQFLQLFDNLITNSIKYSKKDVPLIIDIQADIESNPVILDEVKSGQNYWKISFKDNGIGFDNIYKQKIFELFQRLHGKGEYSGTGIGLAICRKIVQNHNGYITAEGEPGKGAAFHIYLPTH